MGVFDGAKFFPDQPAAAPATPDLGDDFSQGLRSGGYDARGKLNKLAGTAMQAAGLDGSGRMAASAEDQASAAQASAGLTGIRGVHDFSSAAHYAAGTAGQLIPTALPAIGAAMLTKGKAGPMLAGTAATVPFELGGQLERQDADPANANLSPGDRLRAAALPAVGAAAVQNIVPAGVAGRLAGEGAGATLGQAGIRAAADIPANALASAGAEGIRQYGDQQANPNAQYDPQAIRQAGIEGAGAGALFAGAGLAGHLAHAGLGGSGEPITPAKALAPDTPSEAPTAPSGASATPGDTAAAPQTPQDLPTKLQNIFTSAKDGASALMEKMANGSEVATPEALAADPHGAAAAADQTTFEFAKQLASKLMTENLPADKLAQLQSAMSDLGDKVNQQTVAMLAKGQQAVATAKDAVGSFADAVKSEIGGFRDDFNAGVRKGRGMDDNVIDGATRDVPDAPLTLKSEDFSGVRAKIGEAITSTLGEDHPVLQDPATTAKFADALRPFMERVASGMPLDSDTLTRMMDITGDKTAAVLSAVHDAIGDPGADKEAFFKTVNQIDAVQKGRQGVLETMQKNLTPELQQTVRPSQLREVAEQLQQWAQRKPNSLKGANETAAHDGLVMQHLKAFFGDKADLVMAAVEKNTKHEENILDTANTSERVTADGVSSVKYYGQNKQLYLHPDKDKGGVTKNGVKYEGAAAQAMKRAERDNPGAHVSFKKASEIGMEDPMVKAKHADLTDEAMSHGLDEEQAKAHADKAIDNFGVVSAEASKQETAINPGELDKMRLDTKAFGKSPSRLDAGTGPDGKPVIVDAIKMIKAMKDKLKDQYTKSDDTSTLARTVNLFKEGVAAIQTHLGHTFDIPDSTQITPGKNGVTWGEAQKAVREGTRTAEDRASDDKTNEINRLRAEFRAADSMKEKAAIAKEGKKLVGEKEWDVIKEQLPDDHTRAPKITKREDGVHEITRREAPAENSELRSDNVHEDLKGEGELKADKQGNVKEVGKANEAAVIRTNLGGEARGDTVMGRRKPAASVEGAPPGPKELAAKQAAFTEKARSGDKALIDTLSKSTDAKGLQRAAEHIAGMKGEGFDKVADAINDRLGELMKADPQNALDLQTKAYSREATDPKASSDAVTRAAVAEHINKVLGPNVKLLWTNMMHAGEFTRTMAGDVIRLSVHALDPMSTAYHESLHGFFARLRDAGHDNVAGVLERAANAAPVLNQLRELLKNEPDALRQLKNPEERAAYMYQAWANGKLNLGPQATGLFGKIAKFLRSVTGLWTNDEKALRIMEHFHSGEYEKTASDPNAMSRVLGRDPGGVFEKVKALTEPLRKMGEAVASAGGARLRDTGIPALRELADTMKLKNTSEGKDTGFVPSARAERARIMNQVMTDLKPYGKDAINEAMEAMQNGVKAQSLAGRTVAKIISKHLADTKSYLEAAGVKVNDISQKDGVPYLPRSWDASYISSHQRQFLAMLDKSGISNPREVMQRLMVSDGDEFKLNNDGISKPGMQNLKQRTLTMVAHADAAPFMRKDMYQIMNSYVTQATRRAEWARRFGDDNAGLNELMTRAKAQGATPEQLKTASDFVKGVDGTLGDDINPTTRRLMGNMIVYQNLRLLPLGIFSSAVDAQGIIVNGGSVGDAFKTFGRGMKEVVKNFQSDPKSDKMTQLAEAIGTVDNAMLVHTLGASYSQGMVGNLGRKINDTFFRANLMEQFNTSMRVGATEAAMNFLVKHSQAPGEHSGRFLRELGLEAKDVQVGADGRPKILQSDGLSLEHSAKMKAAVNRWVDGAILRPDAVDKPIWMNDPNYALVAHLKQFVFAFHETILKKVAHEAANGNYAPGMALASYVPMMIAADYLKGFIQGGGQQPDWKENWGPADYAWSGMQRAGIFGVGQFGIDMAKDVHEGGSGLGALAGPTVQQLGEGLQVLGGREQFRNFAIKSLPANALYAAELHAPATDPQFSD